MNRALDLVTSYASSVFSLGSGFVARDHARTPEKLLELYEFEQCPFCRKVREALSELDLDVMIYPCPPGGTRFREKAIALGGKKQFPFLVDPNTGAQRYESNDIVRHLVETYGDGTTPSSTWGGPLANVRAMAASLPRVGRVKAVPSRAPEQPLELWSFEVSPYCRIAREALCNLELPYVLHNVAKRGQRREAFIALSGKMMVPYLVDPNTGTSLFESADISRYLYETYRA